ncbi:hypothetical protein ERJ75_000831700 [Trypanosoma vivax]|nr:hypothetical protein ERJ75_000831700 [Trypanosoma vivax]
MRPFRHHADTTLSLATVTCKTALRLSSSSSLASSPCSKPTGPQAAAQRMLAGRSVVPHKYLQGANTHHPSTVVSVPLRRRRRYEPFAYLLKRYIERGFVDVNVLLSHPEAPSPMELVLHVMRHRTPCVSLAEAALTAVLSQPRLTSTSGTASYALQTVAQVIRQRCPHLYGVPAVRVLLCQALLSDRLFTDALEVLQEMPDSWITPGLWALVMDAAGQGKIPHSPLLWRLLTLSPLEAPGDGHVVRTGARVVQQLAGTTAGGTVTQRAMGQGDGHLEPPGSPCSGRVRTVGYGGDSGIENTTAFSAFDVRPASILRLVHADGQQEWCQLSTAEVGYAEQHYCTVRDTRAWGHGVLGYTYSGSSGREGVLYGLDARLASQLMLRANVSFFGQSSPLIALHILRRHLRTCQCLREQRETRSSTVLTAHPSSTDSKELVDIRPANGDVRLLQSEQGPVASSDRGVANASDEVRVHPSPFLLFFKIIRETRDVLSGGGESPYSGGPPTLSLPMVHWSLVWRYFQILNRECPTWYAIIPAEAEDLSRYVIDVLCRGADPWMTLNVARAVSSRHIIDGLDMSLWLLHRLDASHHAEEARDVTRKVFRWLLTDAGVHLIPHLHHHLIPASRVLIRLGLQDELRQLYNGVLDNVYMFAEDFRTEFVHVMRDLVCPSCSSILPVQDVFVERTCPICLMIVPAKDAGALPSFQLSQEHIARLREKRRATRLSERQRLRERVYRWSKSGGYASGCIATSAVQPAGDGAVSWQTKSRSPPPDAALTLKREVLGDTVPLIPGVPVKKQVPYFLLEDSNVVDTVSGEAGLPFDVHVAMEESSKRLHLQEAARRYVLAQRGVEAQSHLTVASPPSLISSPSSLSSSSSLYRTGAQHPQTTVASMRLDGPWVCVWCQEHNSEFSSRVHCVACGAETGPSALWRQFEYATSTHDIMEEIRARVLNAAERPVDAVVAAYLLMVYRRAFLLRATPHDTERVGQLIRRLCQLHERVLAGYIYMRFVPARLRRKDETLLAVAQLFGCSESDYATLTTPQQLQDESTFFRTVFLPTTCKVCFGQHNWKSCPIITRDFSTVQKASITMTPEEKQRAMLEQLRQVVQAAVQGRAEDGRLIVDAYTAFVRSSYRELFAEVHSRDVNRLSILLSRSRQYRRAAFVLCHIPLQLRDNVAYTSMLHYFNVSIDEAQELLSKRSPIGVADESHPNFVQVALTCCMCLDERHASFECPRLRQWMNDANVLGDEKAPDASERALASCVVDSRSARRLRAQVDGWISAGPERLHAFYRFLLQNIDTFQDDAGAASDSNGDGEGGRARGKGASHNVPHKVVEPEAGLAGVLVAKRRMRRIDMSDPIIYALNQTIIKLAASGHKSSAYRLYARAPVAFITRLSTKAMLRLSRFSEESIRSLMSSFSSGGDVVDCSNNGGSGLNRGSDGGGSSCTSAHISFVDDAVERGKGDDTRSTNASCSEAGSLDTGISSEVARVAAVPLQTSCLLCFDSGHTYFDCPELAAQATPAAKLEYVATQVGGIRSSVDGVRAAAAYVYHAYNLGQLTGELLRAHPALLRALLRLVHRCFAAGLVAAGVRVLRRLPVEAVPPLPVYTDLWRAAGLPEATVSARRERLVALFTAEGLEPCIESPPARQTYSNQFVAGLSQALHDDLCRHCYLSGHTLATCSVFHAEVSFGRDYVAAYRMSMMSEQLDHDWRDAYLLKLVDFFVTHKVFMPYHIVGVTNALNAIAAMWSFRGEPGIAMRHLLNIPPPTADARLLDIFFMLWAYRLRIYHGCWQMCILCRMSSRLVASDERMAFPLE